MSEDSASQPLPRRKQIVTTKGPAVGRITGINHMVLYTHDMDECVRFYRDLLGMKVVRTVGWFENNAASLNKAAKMSAGPTTGDGGVKVRARQVFFQIGNGDLVSFYEVRELDRKPNASIVSFLWPKTGAQPPRHLQKLDHLAFNVRSRADLQFMREHLIANGVTVSEPVERSTAEIKNRFVISIYFSDPSNNPLEIATLDLDDPVWEDYDYSEWFRDEDPAPSLLK
ncbi:MAG: VOC family protein [Betaproteobacteria bacterium]|nr:VOC family protein [Betaproteobacteria bacterium]